jgi:hypothetical protein
VHGAVTKGFNKGKCELPSIAQQCWPVADDDTVPSLCLLWLSTGGVSLATALVAGGCCLRSLDMSGCELTDAAAVALAGLLAAAPAAQAPAAAVGGLRSPLKWRAAAAVLPAEERVQLQELRLVDNQITSAGVCGIFGVEVL